MPNKKTGMKRKYRIWGFDWWDEKGSYHREFRSKKKYYAERAKVTNPGSLWDFSRIFFK